MSVTLYDNTVLTVEVGFSTSAGTNKVPLNANLSDIVWTDVSAYVVSISTQRGRNNELDEVSTGTANVVLSNRDRRFDPEYSAGPYYGALTPGRPIRVRAAYNGGTTYGIFFGWVDGWAQNYDFPNQATVTVTASDAFKILNQLVLRGSWDLETEKLSPWAWWKFGESAPSTAAVGYGSRGANLLWVNASEVPTTAQPATSLMADADSGAATINANALIVNGWNASRVFGDYSNETLELTFSTSTTASGSYGIARFQPYEFTMGVGMNVSGEVGKITFWSGSIGAPNSVDIYTSTIQVNDGQPHIIHLPLNGPFLATPVLPMVDGVQATYVTSRTWSGYDPADIRSQIGLPMTQLSGNNFTSSFVGTIDEVVIHSACLTATQCATRVKQMLGTYGLSDSTGTRLGVLLDYVGWMADARAISTGLSTMSGLSTSGKAVLAAVKVVNEAEQGRLFVDVDGDVHFTDREDIFTVATYSTSQATFGDSTGELPYTDVTFSYDDRLIVNRSSVDRVNGATSIVNDTSSQGEYFIRSESLPELAIDNDDFAYQLASYRVLTYKQPSLRVESIEVKPRIAPADLFPKVLAYDVGTRITVNRRPQNVGSVISKTLLIEGIAHNITVDGWTTRWSLSPVPFDVFILNSATKGVLDTNRLGL
jgi:hypothetical protein